MSVPRGLRPWFVVAGAVALLGLVAGGALALSGRAWVLVVTTRLPLALAVGGVVVAGAVVAVGAARGRRVRVRAAAVADAEAAARADERARHRRFLQRLDHELKNPVTAIRAAVAGLGPAAASDDGAARAHATLDAQAGRLAHLVADLRKLAELETQPIEQEDVDVAQVVRDAVDDVLAQAQAAGRPRPAVTVSLPTVPWPLPHVRGDVDLLYLAVYNLLGNAVKFSPPGTPVEVRGSDEGGTVVVEVADSGPGVPDDEVGVVFDELARGRDARGTPGSGLGLALVRVIAERHGGRATLRSRVGHGTVVRLHLPADRP
ncbi:MULTISPECIES: sensor histidine kinase [Cellulomonas]|uniref:histidine kinase n=1 Tax=Cellulomonas iranensis TaxID=76862 RepID=A0ABU0GK59_9CELL|nr:MULTISPECIES: HAMP domain-containing sensor histidine kinase [Cellulomonas]MDQ0425741.1 two-component system OmpR family sensor kinase [Cellulomonas iranensis]